MIVEKVLQYEVAGSAFCKKVFTTSKGMTKDVQHAATKSETGIKYKWGIRSVGERPRYSLNLPLAYKSDYKKTVQVTIYRANSGVHPLYISEKRDPLFAL